MKSIQVTRTSLPPYDEYCAEIRKFWDSRMVSNIGEEHKAFEKELQKYLGSRQLRLFANGHLALEAAIRAMGLPPGSEVITVPYTFPSTVHAIVRWSLKPVFCDVLESDCTMDPAKVENLISEKTSAIIPVHVYGNPCDVYALGAIADRNGLKLIYDAAHAFGVSYEGTPLVNFGDASMMSFHATKVFSTIEGGAVFFSGETLSSALEDERNFGIRDYESCVYAGGNAKMNEFQAAMGMCNLRHINHDLARRRQIRARYERNLAGVKGLRIASPRSGTAINGAYVPVILERDRDRIAEKLAGDGIFCRKYFYPPVNRMECYEGRFPAGATPVSDYLSSRVLSMPIYPDLEAEDVDIICRQLLLYL